MSIIPIIVVLAVFAAIAIRDFIDIKIQLWQIMLFGAIAVLATGQISPINAFDAINFNVILFLLSMFIIGQAMESSGYLEHIAFKIFKRTKTSNEVLAMVVIGGGIISAFLVNDALVIISIPIIFLISRKIDMPTTPLLLGIAFAVTIGSTMSPIGNPQNLIIASDMANPFANFFGYLLVPTLINLVIAFFLIKFVYRKHFNKKRIFIEGGQGIIKNKKLARLSKISLALIIIMVIINIISVVFFDVSFNVTYVALVAALPIILFSSERFRIVKDIDWFTLVFFAAMFVLMQSVWYTGIFESAITKFSSSITSIPVILSAGVIASQFLSNVPFVILYLPMLISAKVNTVGLLALAVGSTIAGNFTLLGAASNLIIAHNVEKKYKEKFRFFDFLKIGAPLTLINIFVYWVFLTYI